MPKLNAIDIYTQHAREQDPKAFLKQGWRTINGEDIPAEQLNSIKNLICKNLELEKEDIVLDLFCGNGHLSSLFIDKIKGLHGVDGSEYLIQIANENFKIKDKTSYACADLSLLNLDSMLQNSLYKQNDFTKILIFGSIQFIQKSMLSAFFTFLYKNFINVKNVYMSPIPNKNSAAEFYQKRNIDISTINLDDVNSQIGCWHDPKEFMEIASRTGWKVQEIPFEKGHYQSFYRFNILLSR